MEIKTIEQLNDLRFLQQNHNTQWVRVEDVIKALDEGFGVENGLPTIKPLFLLQMYKDLTGYELSQSNPSNLNLSNLNSDGNDKLSNPDTLKGGINSCELQSSGRDTLIHHWKKKDNDIETDCGLSLCPMISDWSLVSCPDCLKHRGKK